MTIRVICKKCNSKINAPDSLLGKVRHCPKCQSEILIQPEEDAVQSIVVPQTVPVPSSIGINDAPAIGSAVRYIKRLNPSNLYVIVSHDRIMAYWKAGEGWFYNVGSGYVPAKRHINEIPEYGDFTFIEGFIKQTENGQRLVGVRFFALSGTAVLVSIGRSETEVLEKIVQPCSLTSANKRFFLKFIREKYFSQFTEDAMDIVEFLTNQDFHSREIGTIEKDTPLGT